MNEVLTLAEIEERYQSEWVLVGDPETAAGSLQVKGGTVLAHSPDRDELYRKAIELKPLHSAILYTGRIAEGMELML